MIERYISDFSEHGLKFHIIDFAKLEPGEFEKVVHAKTDLVYAIDKDGDPAPICCWGMALLHSIASGAGDQEVIAIGLALDFNNEEEVHNLCEALEAAKGFHEWPLPV